MAGATPGEPAMPLFRDEGVNENLGFANPHHFSRVFSRLCRPPPSQR